MNKVYTLRGIDDVKEIVEGITPNAKVAIIGTSFIGMEVSGNGDSKPCSEWLMGVLGVNSSLKPSLEKNPPLLIS